MVGKIGEGRALAVSGPMLPEFIDLSTGELGDGSVLEKANSVVEENAIEARGLPEQRDRCVPTRRIRKVAVDVETTQGSPGSPTHCHACHAYFRLPGFIHCHLLYKRLPSSFAVGAFVFPAEPRLLFDRWPPFTLDVTGRGRCVSNPYSTQSIV